MASTIFGIADGDIVPALTFDAQRDGKGNWRVRRDYNMTRATWVSTARQTFVKGQPITAIDATLDAYWVFALLEEVDVQDQEGGLTIVSVLAIGKNESDFELEPGVERELVYTANGARAEQSILDHPLYKHEIDNDEWRDIIAETYDRNVWVRDPRQDPLTYPTQTTIWRAQTQTEGRSYTDPNFVKWWNKIFVEGIRTWEAPTLEWTKETSGDAGLTPAQLQKLGFIDDPEGPAPTPTDGNYNWRKVSATDVLTNDVYSTSQTWELSPPGGFDVDLYGYDPSILNPPP